MRVFDRDTMRITRQRVLLVVLAALAETAAAKSSAFSWQNNSTKNTYFDSGDPSNASSLALYAARWEKHLRTWRSIEDKRVAGAVPAHKKHLTYVQAMAPHYGVEKTWLPQCGVHLAGARVIDYGGGPGILGYVLLKGEYGLSSYHNIDIAHSSLARTQKNLKNWSAIVSTTRAVGPTDVQFASLTPSVFFCVGGVIVHMADAYFAAWAANVDACGAASIVIEYRKSEMTSSPHRPMELIKRLANYTVVCERDFDRDFNFDATFPKEQQRHMVYFQRRQPGLTGQPHRANRGGKGGGGGGGKAKGGTHELMKRIKLDE